MKCFIVLDYISYSSDTYISTRNKNTGLNKLYQSYRKKLKVNPFWFGMSEADKLKEMFWFLF